MITQKFPYAEIKRTRVEGKRLYDTDSGFLPSVTTILDKTKPAESVQALNNWRRRVGDVEAARISKEAAGVGTLMHGYLENWLIKDNYDRKDNILHRTAGRMADTVIENIKDDLTEVWGTEVGLYYPGLYAGTTDLPGVWKSRDSILDFKQTNKPKKREWISDYFMQATAYGMAHNELFGTNIRSAAIFMCSRDCEFQLFEIVDDEFDHWSAEWSRRVEQYYNI
jgi:hypothetical protein